MSAIRRELEAIAGRPNWTARLRLSSQVRYKLLYWWVTTKGQRAFDWHRLLVLKDRATDLGCEAQFARYQKPPYACNRMPNRFCYPCPPEFANCVCVWVKH